MRPATIFLGIWRRGDGLARAEEGSGEESARASAFCFGEILAGYELESWSVSDFGLGGTTFPPFVKSKAWSIAKNSTDVVFSV